MIESGEKGDDRNREKAEKVKGLNIVLAELAFKMVDESVSTPRKEIVLKNLALRLENAARYFKSPNGGVDWLEDPLYNVADLAKWREQRQQEKEEGEKRKHEKPDPKNVEVFNAVVKHLDNARELFNNVGLERSRTRYKPKIERAKQELLTAAIILQKAIDEAKAAK